ncbi:hypothetical protein F3Y22_tig00112234pilonHSYRG00005 [Hibiscus syriacus]|uniref:PH domain-containing protein n=1 Tax=Hibiscus syriacus TaxID=106335 RepID=A0A6A2XRG7_HIBSY|nr:hypothetical protein F3Y22_tig00112234pilonHSYRG00005 [Hibiscus syriacus]
MEEPSQAQQNASSQKRNEVNLTLGGIDLNNSGSVVVKADKKLITVKFQDDHDGRTFTLKAETSEDLYEWKAALEKALSQASSSAGGQNGVFGNDQADAIDSSKEPVNDKQPERSTVLHRPILLALEDVDGAPTFLEKALRFVEEHGVKVEGILRQTADVEDVERRIREFEQVDISSCPCIMLQCAITNMLYVYVDNPYRVKFLYYELVGLIRNVVEIVWLHFCELYGIAFWMIIGHVSEAKSSYITERPAWHPYFFPLLSGDCEIEIDFDEWKVVFPLICTLTQKRRSESEEETDDDESYEDDECEDESQGSDDDNNSAESRTSSESGQSVKSGDDKQRANVGGRTTSTQRGGKGRVTTEKGGGSHGLRGLKLGTFDLQNDSESSSSSSATETNKPNELSKGVHGVTKLEDTSTRQTSVPSATKPPVVGNGPSHHGNKTVSMGFTDLPCEEEALRLSLKNQTCKRDSQKSLEKRKKTLHEQRLALEKEVARLEEELQSAREKRMALEAGINPSQGPAAPPVKLDEKLVQSFRVNSSASALTKLTNSLNNLMKELRSQTENETAGMEKGSDSSQAAPSSSDKGKGAEPIKTVKKGDKGKGAEPTKSVKNP